MAGPLGNAAWQNILQKAHVAESIVNGQWVEVLHNYFPAPAFIICPEGRDTANGRTDMVVLQVRNNGGAMERRRVLAFEGKRGADNPPATTQAFFNNLPQLAGYMANNARLGQYRYGFLALGAQAVLMSWQQGAAQNDIYEVRIGAGGVVRYGQPNNSLTVANANDAQELGLLMQVVNNAAVDPNNQAIGWSTDFT